MLIETLRERFGDAIEEVVEFTALRAFAWPPVVLTKCSPSFVTILTFGLIS
jgi:hypothetical protein